MVTIRVDEVYRDWRTEKEKVTKTATFEAETLDDAFKKAYPMERTLRYCNDYFIRVFDELGNSIQDKFQEWKKTGLTIDLYYGGGVVD